MDTRTGKIYPTESEARRKAGDFAAPMKIPTTPLQRSTGYVGKYDPCPCGSGRKFKFCCWVGDSPKHHHEGVFRAIVKRDYESARHAAQAG